MDETFASLAQGHLRPHAFDLLLIKLDRAYGSKPRTNILRCIKSFDVTYGTSYIEYLPAYRSLIIDLLTGDPVYRLLVGTVIVAVRDNIQ